MAGMAVTPHRIPETPKLSNPGRQLRFGSATVHKHCLFRHLSLYVHQIPWYNALRS